MEFARNKSLLNKIIVVDGIGKCGKSLLMDLISSFHAVEKPQFNSCLEFIGYAYQHNKISLDMAVSILRTEIDTALYNNMIGRNINTRLTDDTSVYRYHSPEKYLKRALEPDGSSIYEKVLTEKPIYLCWTHNLIHKSDIIFEAFGRTLEFVYLNRRPIDIIFEWNRAEYSKRMAMDPTEMQYSIKYKNTVVPEIARGWEEEYLNCTTTERTVKMIYCFFKYNYEVLQKKQKLRNLHVFNFEELLADPVVHIDLLKNILGSQPLSDIIVKTLRNANCPRKIDENSFMERENEIKQNVSQYYLDLLNEMSVMHEKICEMDVKMASKQNIVENVK